MSTEYKGQIALVTGASRGIGRATALAAASRGYKVVVGYASNKPAAETGTGTILSVKLRSGPGLAGELPAALRECRIENGEWKMSRVCDLSYTSCS